MDRNKFIGKQRLRRKRHVRNKQRASLDRPRMSVFRSHKHIYCQVIDDQDGKTIAAASTRDAELRGQVKYGGNKDAAEAIGKAVAEKVLAAGVKAVRFDRGSYKYHGRVAALADAARKAGLQF